MECNKECISNSLEDTELLFHLLDKHKYILPALKYTDVELKKTSEWEPPFTSDMPCFFQTMAMGLPEKFAHPQDVVDTFPSTNRKFLVEQGMPFNYIPKFCQDNNIHMVMHVHGDKAPYQGYCDIGNKELQPIYIRYNYGVHYNLVQIEDYIQLAQLDETLEKLTFNINSLIEQNTIEHNVFQESKQEIEVFSAQLTKHLNDILGNIEALRTLPRDFMITLTASIVSSIISIASALVTLITNKVNMPTKALNVVSIITNLTAFAWSVYGVCKYWKIAFDVENVISGLPALIEAFTNNKEKRANSVNYVGPAITTVVSLLLSGIVAFTPLTIRDMISGGSMIKATKEYGTTAEQIVKFIADDVCELNIFGNKHHYDAIVAIAKEGTTLITTPTYKFFQDPTLITKLRSFPHRVVELTSKKIPDKELSHAITSAKILLNQTLSTIYEKIAAIDAVVDNKSRQECFAIYLAGTPGAGKSKLCLYIAQKIAAIMGYNPRVFNLQREGTFSLPYGGEVFGIFNEFMNLRSENDDLLPRFNGVVSGDPYNFESAHLGGKVQPCMIKLVFLTSNIEAPNLTRTLVDSAASAVWSRCMRYTIDDPKFEGRMGKNLHRKDDFSHLTIERIVNNDHIGTNLIKERVTVDSLIGAAVYQLARRELNFFKNHECQLPPERTLRLEQLCNKVQHLEANAQGQSFFVIRIQGDLDTGKSTLSNEITSMFDSILPQHKVYHLTSIDDFGKILPTSPGIYCIDDIMYRDQQTTYFNWINQGSPDNIYILVTTDIYERKSVSLLNSLASFMLPGAYPKSYIVDTVAPEGFGRRIGLEGLIRIKTKERTHDTFNPPHLCATITTHKGFRISNEGQDLNISQLKDLLFRRYISYVKATNLITIVNEPYRGSNEHTVQIKTDDYTTLLDVLSDPIKLFRAYSAECNNTTVRVENNFARVMFGKTFVKDWIVPERIEQESDFLALAMRMTGSLRRADPYATCHIEFRKLNKEMIYADNTIHWDCQLIQAENFSLNHEGYILCRVRSKEIIISPDDYARFSILGIISDDISNIPYGVLSGLNPFYHKMEKDMKLKYELARMQIGHKKSANALSTTTIMAILKQNKIVFISAGLIALAGISGIGYTLYKLLASDDNKVEYNANSADDEEGEFGKFTQRMRKNVMTGNKATAQAIRDEAKVAGFGDRLARWEYEWRSNTLRTVQLPPPTPELIHTLLGADPHKQLPDYMQQYPKETAEFLYKRSNGLSEVEEQFQKPSCMDNFVSMLTHMYFQIIAPSGTNYAISIGNGLVLSVSHIVNRCGDLGRISSMGTLYPVRCVALSSDRDLSVWVVTSKQKPPTPELKKYLTSAENFENVNRAWFVRPSATKPFSSQANVSFVEYSPVRRYDSLNNRYRPYNNLWDFSLINLSCLKQTIKKGDCGLPLVALINNELKIIGIHNAYSDTGDATYSGISLEDIDLFTYGQIKTTANTFTEDNFLVHQLDPKKQHFTTVPELRKSVLSDWQVSKFEGVSKLDVYGFNPSLHIYSQPKHKKRFIPIPGSTLQCESLPSALTYDPRFITDESNLVKDKHGNPHTLFTQCVKYADRTSNYRQWDEEVLQHAFSLVKMRIERDYGEFKSLNTKEVLNGMSKLQPFDLMTSAGPYFKIFHNIINKEKLLVNKAPEGVKPYYDWNPTTYGNILQDQYKLYVNSISSGVPVFVVSKDNAKVELLPREKVKTGKVRLFNELDFAVNMMLKKFFGQALNSIMEHSTDKPYAIGSNAYVLGTAIQREFNTISGNIISTDYSSMDKSMCQEVIQMFCDTFLSYLPKPAREAMANTLTYTLHTMDGHLYSVNSGNESGSFVTTMLNCYCVELILFYTIVTDFAKKQSRYPSLKEVCDVVKYRIMGDDMTAKLAIDIDLSMMTECASMFNMKLTPAKVLSDNPSFCSREIVKSNIHPHIYFSRLKKSSITTCLFYFSEVTPVQIAANINVALFEASMWDEEFFNEVQKTANILIRKYNCGQYYEGYTYQQYRNQISQYILGYALSPTLLAVSNQNSQIQDYKSNTLLLSRDISSIMDPICVLNEYVQKHQLKPFTWDEKNVGTPNQPIWEVTMTFHDVLQTIIKSATEAGKKTKARHAVASQVVAELLMKTANSGEDKYYIVRGQLHEYDLLNCNDLEITSDDIRSFRDEDGDYVAEYIIDNVVEYQSKQPTRIKAINKILKLIDNNFASGYVYECMKIQVTLAKTLAKELKLDAVWLYVDKTKVEYTEADKSVCKGIHYYYVKGDVEDKYLVLSGTSQQFKYSQVSHFYELFGAILHNEGIYLDMQQRANAGDPMVEPSSIQQTAVNSQAGTLPPPMNPQPTGQVPALAPAGENAISAVEGIQTQVLNPVGAPNMTGVGAVMFDIKTLIYSQFMDSDVEIQLTDDAPSGSILLQIPYDPLGVHVNKYIRSYVSQHERYTGALQFRFTVVGNPLFSGYIGIGWQPRKVATSTMDISEFQKFAYDSKGVTLPWSEVHVLHDARKNDFYREVSDTNIDSRPHLVVALIVSIQNPLREGVITRIRVASKLSSMGEPNPFFAVLPSVASTTLLARSSESIGSNQINLFDMFPQALTQRLWIYTDGVYSTQDRRNRRKTFKMLFHQQQGAGFGESSLENTRTLGYADSNAVTSFNSIGGPIDFPKPNGIFAIYVTTNCDIYHAYRIAQSFKVGTASASNYWNNLITGTAWSIPRNEFISSTFDSTNILISTSTTGETRICGAVKIITERGIAVFSLVGYFDSVSANLIPSRFYLPSSVVDSEIALSPQPYANIDNVLISSNPEVERLPIGYLSLKISELAPSSITIEGMMLPTSNNEQTVLAVFRRRAQGLSTTKVLQFTLTDTVSVRTIATVRFLQESDEFVISVPTDMAQYRVLGVSNSNIAITNITSVDRTNDFPVTNISSWINRTASDFVRRSDMFKSYGLPSSATNANGAMMGMQMAGGAMSGLGNALGQASQNKFQEQMQGNQFGHEKSMQGSQFGHEAMMQGNMFNQQNKYQSSQYAHENQLQNQSHLFQQSMQQSGFDQSNYQMGETFGQQNKLQQQQFGHDVDMSNLSHSNTMTQQAAQSRNRMTERGVSSSIFSAPGAGTIAMRA